MFGQLPKKGVPKEISNTLSAPHTPAFPSSPRDKQCLKGYRNLLGHLGARIRINRYCEVWCKRLGSISLLRCLVYVERGHIYTKQSV
ncbi:hypothetical protein GDO81_026699 [Engystomops pustulosus]|uniref:Uncharacterized protein n=1 Tax=Engystomops pustulosus TaxID=76066 RepID=A0AAV6YR80_ENGPU|nr:hypothetical protein GDO81_026699 [Engystomops pustulosus]